MLKWILLSFILLINHFGKSPVFKDFNNGQYKTVMVYAKKARGAMAAFIIKNKIEKIEGLVAFDTDGYCYNKEVSSENELVFYRG